MASIELIICSFSSF